MDAPRWGVRTVFGSGHERRALGRLLVVDVGRVAAEPSVLESGHDIGFHDELAARGVDEADSLLHPGDRGRVYHAAGLVRERRVEGDVVGFRKYVVQG